MICRELQLSDVPELKLIHEESGLRYQFPALVIQHEDGTRELDAERFPAMRTIVDEKGRPLFSAVAHKTVEVYGFCRLGEWETPGMKTLLLNQLHCEMIEDLKQKGFSNAHSWVPKKTRNFQRHLTKRFGWVFADGSAHDWVGIVREF